MQAAWLNRSRDDSPLSRRRCRGESPKDGCTRHFILASTQSWDDRFAYLARTVCEMSPPLFVKAFAAGAVLYAICASVQGESAGDLMRKGDAFDATFQATEALQFYLPAEELEPANVRILVRIARQYRYLMADATGREEKLRLGGIALQYAQRAAALAPDDAEAQLSIAISYGKMLPLMGIKEQIEASRHIKKTVDRAIAIDPHNDLAWHVLGRWHRVLAEVSTFKRSVAGLVYGELPRTTTEQAVRCFQKAIEINPRRLMHYVELGRAYAQMGRTAEARQFIEKGLAMPDVGKDDPETRRRGKETLAKLR
jgi:tetratricopeptide (TPR) repeat protein